MCVNHPKVLTSQELSSPVGVFSLKSFHRLVILGGRIEPTACLVLFVHKNVEKSLQKAISKMANSSKNIFKKIKMFHEEHTKRGKYCFIDF